MLNTSAFSLCSPFLPTSLTYFNFPLPLFDGDLVNVLRESGGVLGNLSSSSLLKVTPPFMHMYVMIAR